MYTKNVFLENDEDEVKKRFPDEDESIVVSASVALVLVVPRDVGATCTDVAWILNVPGLVTLNTRSFNL